jgi:acetyl-CoA carboxylase biotin carboxylase subunit
MNMQMFKKILIANRGEIAVRVARACREMGIRSVTVFSDADRASLHVRLADEAYRIGPAPSRESYLVIDKILKVAKSAQCDAIHPGYGFLAENADFSRACAREGITFIGPSAGAMEQLGSKTAARQLAKKMGVPTVPGTIDPIESSQNAAEIAREIGFPVVLKAVAGGGGKGMRLVEKEMELPAAWREASSEATNAFGDGRLYLEKFLIRPRHVEIQVLADHHGHTVYLGERECSVQRRYQKVIEEAPSPIATPELRRAMGEAAVKLARAGDYANAGTMEFLVDAERNFYFLEMNTRLQVEHPVTEMVTALDLVKLQIHVACGDALPFAQENIELRGHAIECRIYAEDPDNNFYPSPGKILKRRAPSGPGIRVDDGVYEGWTVPLDYDPMLDKVIVWGASRDETIARMTRALNEYYATGIQTNVSLFRRILSAPEFLRGEIHTGWLDEFLAKPTAALVASKSEKAREILLEDAATLAAGFWFTRRSETQNTPAISPERTSRWKTQARREQVSEPLDQ